ncbi:MAG: hypothetical protein ACI4WR_01610 [Bulleidia sp.]
MGDHEDLMLYGMSKTEIGEFCISDHCRNAVGEMEWLDQCFVSLKSHYPDASTLEWDQLRQKMPSWETLHQRYSPK